MIQTWKIVLIDAFLTLVSIVFALMIRLEIVFVGFWLGEIFPFIAISMVVRPLLLFAFGVYRSIWRYAATRDFLQLVYGILSGTCVLTVITYFWLYPLVGGVFPRSLLVLEAITSLVFFTLFRFGLRIYESQPADIDWKAMELPEPKRVMIVGAGSAGTQIAKELLQNPVTGLRPVVFLDDDPKKIGRRIGGIPIEGPLIHLEETANKKNIQEVLIAIPSAASQTLQNVKNICQNIPLPYSIMPAISSILDYSSTSPSPYKLPMALPDITSEEIQAVVRVMQSHNLSIGSQTSSLESQAAALAQTKYGVAVMNGTCGLHLCTIAAGIGPGDEVITSPFSFIASANCILYQQAKPVFVDVDPITLNIAPEKIEASITSRTKGIIPVHIFGQPADMDPIVEISKKHNLTLIEDAAEAIGAAYKGTPVGGIGKAGIFAFYPNKQMTTGEGAVITTNDENWANLFRSLRNQGRDIFDEWLRHSRLGYNYRMSELNAAVGVAQLRRLDELLQKRDNVARKYSEALSSLPGVAPLQVVPNTTKMSWFVYVVRFAPEINRDRVMKSLADRGIPARPYFSPIHLQPFYRKQFGFKEGDFPVAEAAGNSTLALPFHGNMKLEEIEVVTMVISDILKDPRQR